MVTKTSADHTRVLHVIRVCEYKIQTSGINTIPGGVGDLLSKTQLKKSINQVGDVYIIFNQDQLTCTVSVVYRFRGCYHGSWRRLLRTPGGPLVADMGVTLAGQINHVVNTDDPR